MYRDAGILFFAPRDLLQATTSGKRDVSGAYGDLVDRLFAPPGPDGPGYAGTVACRTWRMLI